MHNCIIGILHEGYHGKLATLENLKEHIAEKEAFNRSCDATGFVEVKVQEYTLKEYADRRRSTDMTPFLHCPECGARIDWKKIGEEEQNAETD